MFEKLEGWVVTVVLHLNLVKMTLSRDLDTASMKWERHSEGLTFIAEYWELK